MTRPVSALRNVDQNRAVLGSFRILLFKDGKDVRAVIA
jgi:hypothetical protein